MISTDTCSICHGKCCSSSIMPSLRPLQWRFVMHKGLWFQVHQIAPACRLHALSNKTQTAVPVLTGCSTKMQRKIVQRLCLRLSLALRHLGIRFSITTSPPAAWLVWVVKDLTAHVFCCCCTCFQADIECKHLLQTPCFIAMLHCRLCCRPVKYCCNPNITYNVSTWTVFKDCLNQWRCLHFQANQQMATSNCNHATQANMHACNCHQMDG